MRWTRRKRWALASVVGLGVLLRLASALGQDDLKDGYHTWWIAAHLARTGQYIDPFADQVGARWLPGYHFLAAGMLLVLGSHALLLLRLVNVALAGAAIILVARLAERLSPGAGILAALVYAISPWEAITAARSLPESAAWLLAIAAANLLLAPPDAGRRWQWWGGVLLAVACLFRYEAWLLAFLFGARAARRAWLDASDARSELAPLAPIAVTICGWVVVSAAWTRGLFASSVYAQGHAEAAYQEMTGLHPANPLLRVVGFYWFYLGAVGMIAILAGASAIRAPRRFIVLIPLVFACAVGALVASSGSDGSPRYLGLAVPFAAVLAGESLVTMRDALARWRPRAGVVAVTVLLVAQSVLSASAFAEQSANSFYEAPALRAGTWVAAHPPLAGTLLISESPTATYWSAVDPARVAGATALPSNRASALVFLRANVDLVIYVNDSIEKYPYYRLNVLFPELARGNSTNEFALAYDATGSEKAYGARDVFVYRVLGAT